MPSDAPSGPSVPASAPAGTGERNWWAIGAVVVGIVTLFVFFYIFFNLVVDVLYAALDPRIRYE